MNAEPYKVTPKSQTRVTVSPDKGSWTVLILIIVGLAYATGYAVHTLRTWWSITILGVCLAAVVYTAIYLICTTRIRLVFDDDPQWQIKTGQDVTMCDIHSEDIGITDQSVAKAKTITQQQAVAWADGHEAAQHGQHSNPYADYMDYLDSLEQY